MEKALFIIDMNKGFVVKGNMANNDYLKLVPEQLKLIKKFREEKGLVNFILEGHKKESIEFSKYPEHCIIGTDEVELIDELMPEQNKTNTNTYYKNSINGMNNEKLRKDIKDLKTLKEIVIGGVCTDLCVFDFTLSLARYLDELNRDVKIFLLKSCVDTFDAPGHNKEEYTEMTYKFLKQAGVIIAEDVEDLNRLEKVYKLGGK